MISYTLDVPRAALLLLAAGHVDAAADVLILASRNGGSSVRMYAEGSSLRVRVDSAVAS